MGAVDLGKSVGVMKRYEVWRWLMVFNDAQMLLYKKDMLHQEDYIPRYSTALRRIEDGGLAWARGKAVHKKELPCSTMAMLTQQQPWAIASIAPWYQNNASHRGFSFCPGGGWFGESAPRRHSRSVSPLPPIGDRVETRKQPAHHSSDYFFVILIPSSLLFLGGNCCAVMLRWRGTV